MKNIKLYPDLQAAVGSTEETDLVAGISNVDKILKVAKRVFGPSVNIVQDGDFIKAETNE